MNTIFPTCCATDIHNTIVSVLRCYTIPACITARLNVILSANNTHNTNSVANEFNVGWHFVNKWSERARLFFSSWREKVLSPEGDEIDDNSKKELLLSGFSDAERSGKPPTYSAEQMCKVMAIALDLPTEHGREITNWTHVELADEVNKQGVATSISKSTVGRLLLSADIKPHLSTYWLNPKTPDDEDFKKEINDVCNTYHNALARVDDTYTISVDEKTGIQALERAAASKPMRIGEIEKIEFEYIRHGTLSLTPSFNVVTGKIISYKISETRGEIDFLDHIKQTVALSAESKWIFVADQLNVHKSASLVEYIAKSCGIEEPLGIKGKSGILHNQNSRQAFLTDKSHRIHFVFTPKHCSWLNQVEIWFGILSRKLLARGSFKSQDDLQEKMERFIKYFNDNLAKPFKWTYKGKALAA